MGRITCVEGHTIKNDGKVKCVTCEKKQKVNWDNRDAAHRTCTDHPHNKNNGGKK